MDHDYLALESLASDLKRVALGLHRGSQVMAGRFAQEALKRKSELASAKLPPYIKNLLIQLETATKDPDTALMSSTLFQNYLTHRAKLA